MKNRIYIYFFHEFIRYFAVTLFALTAVLWTIQAVNFLDLVTDDGHAFRIYIIYSFLTLPKIITKLIPLSFLLASLLTILKLEKDNELIILWTSGLNKINIVNLSTVLDEIEFKSKKKKDYEQYPYTKADYLKFFLSHDIPLQYLEDMYEIQSKGMPVVKKNDLIELENHYSFAKYGVVIEERQKRKSKVKFIPLDKNLQPMYHISEYDINIWSSKVVCEFTEENWEIYNRLVAKYNKDKKHRTEYWYNHPVLSSHIIPYGYYNRGYDVMNGDVPLSETYSCLNQKYINDRPTWIIFKNCIDEKLRLERENQ